MTSTDFEVITKKLIGKINYNKLIKRYGCVDNIIKQSKESLSNVVSEKTAEYINNLITFKYTAVDKLTMIASTSDAYSHLYKYCRNKNEVFVCIFLNNSNEILSEEIMHIGNYTSCIVNFHTIIERAISLQAKSLIVAHNHPSNNKIASGEDKKLTDKLKDYCKNYQINLLDSIIITNKGCVSIMHQ